MEPTTHVDINPAKCGGKPCIAGTRIRVWDIHVWHDLRGETPEEIVVHFPHISVADVHAALAYYYDFRDEIEQQMREAEEFAARLEREQGPTRFTRLRDAILGEKDVHDDPVSLG